MACCIMRVNGPMKDDMGNIRLYNVENSVKFEFVHFHLQVIQLYLIFNILLWRSFDSWREGEEHNYCFLTSTLVD